MDIRFEQRLNVILAVRNSHDEEYYKTAARSRGMDFNKLRHTEVAAFKAAMDVIEADIIIDLAKNQEPTKVESLDLSNIK